jgi:decaprenylphospho-beta-D-erythro-pentofuranosid-2-ulose 2-reductase
MKSAQCVLVFGANSAICHEVLKLYALEGANFFLVGRNQEKLQAVSTDLVARGGAVLGVASYDFNEWQKHDAIVMQARQSMGKIDVALVAHGTLPDQSKSETSSALVKSCMDDNFVSVAIIAQAVAQQLAQQTSGTLAVVSSVAGDRGRKSNYTYGAAKAGIDTLLQGLQGRFSGSHVKIVNIKPGMVISPMTSEMRHSAIWSTPERVAPGIYQAIAKGAKVYYVPGYWRLIMLIIRLLPTAILAKLPI